MIDTAKKLKERGAKRVYLCATFGLFTDGPAVFDKAYEEGAFDRVISTNFTYLDPEVLNREWFIVADMSRFIALIIDFINHDASITGVMTPTEKIHEFVRKYNEGWNARDVIPE